MQLSKGTWWIKVVICSSAAAVLISGLWGHFTHRKGLDMPELTTNIRTGPEGTATISATSSSKSVSPTENKTISFSTTCSKIGAALLSDIATTSPLPWVATSTSALLSLTSKPLSFIPDNNNDRQDDFPLGGKAWSVITPLPAGATPFPFNFVPDTASATAEWQPSISLSGVQITPLTLDGGDSKPGLSGFVRRRGDCIQVEISSYRLIDKNTDIVGEVAAGTVSADRAEFTVFLSDWVSLSDLLQDYERLQTAL